MDEQPIEMSDSIWPQDPNTNPLFGHWKRRTFWQWLTRKPRVWVGGLFGYMRASGFRPVYLDSPDEPGTDGMQIGWEPDE